MSHTYTNLLIHIVFGTKGRIPMIEPYMRVELFAYLASLIKEKGGKAMIINGIADHVHLLISLPPNVDISALMNFAKANSSRWMKQRFGKPCEWQKGFGAFSVSRSNADSVARYIRDQELHHREFDYESEFKRLLDKNGIEYEPEYLWK